MGIRLFNTNTGKHEEPPEFFFNKREELKERFKTLDKNGVEAYIEDEIIDTYISKIYIRGLEIMLDEMQIDEDEYESKYESERALQRQLKLDSITFKNKMSDVYRQLSEQNQGYFYTLQKEVKYRHIYLSPKTKSLLYSEDNSVEEVKYPYKDKNDTDYFGYYCDNYFIWKCNKQRLVDTIFLLHEEKKIEYKLNDSKLADLIISKFQFKQGEKINKFNITTMFSRSRKNIPTKKFVFENAKQIVLSVILKEK